MVLGEPTGEGPTIPPHWEFPLINREGLKVLQVRENDGWLAYQLKTAQGEGGYYEVFFNSNGKGTDDLSIIGEVASVSLLKGDARTEIQVDTTNEDPIVRIGMREHLRLRDRVVSPETVKITYGYPVGGFFVVDPDMTETWEEIKPIGIMNINLLGRDNDRIKTTTRLDVDPVKSESSRPKTYLLNQEEGISDEERRWRTDNFDVNWGMDDGDPLRVTEANKKTGEIKTIQCPPAITSEKVRTSAFSKSYIDPATGRLVSLWRELDKLIPVRLSGSRPLPPPKSAMEPEAENI